MHMTLAADSLKETKIKQHRCTYKTIIYLQGIFKIKFCERCFQVSINLQSLHTCLILKKKIFAFSSCSNSLRMQNLIGLVQQERLTENSKGNELLKGKMLSSKRSPDKSANGVT